MAFSPPIEQVPPGHSWCAIHGDTQLVDEAGRDAPTGLCRYCWQELRDGRYTTCGEHGLQEKKEGVDGCIVCALASRVERPKFAPPKDEFGDTESEPPKPATADDSVPAHVVEDKPIEHHEPHDVPITIVTDQVETRPLRKRFKYGGKP